MGKKAKKPTAYPHFVPAGYLRRFVADGKIYVFDKPTGRAFPTHANKIAKKKHFYRLPTDPPDAEPQSEAMLTAAEIECGKVFDKILGRVEGSTAKQTWTLALDEEERFMLALHVALQLARTPLTRIRLAQTRQATFEAAKRFFQDRDPSELAHLDPAAYPLDEQTTHTLMLFSPALVRFARALAKRTFVFFHNCTGLSLYTSDHPVCTLDLTTTEPARLPFAMPEGMEPSEQLVRLAPAAGLFLPMSSRVLVGIAGGPEGGLWPHRDLCVQTMTPRDVRESNGMQVQESHRQVFCSRDDFAFAREAIATHPELADPQRTLVESMSVEEAFAEARARAKVLAPKR